MQRGYIILVVGAALLISGIVVSALWAVPFAGTILRENTILSGASIKSGGSINASTQVMDTSRPISVAMHVERNNETVAVGQIPNNNLRETVRNPNGIIMTNNEFTRGFFTTFKPDINSTWICNECSTPQRDNSERVEQLGKASIKDVSPNTPRVQSLARE
jgi:hypothetical protein